VLQAEQAVLGKLVEQAELEKQVLLEELEELVVQALVVLVA
jgi:hypothetical protein|tara:strand:+ start:798 stop:920 length:123 start_codon:yes stop_codon:yes gene_type:complete